MGKKEKSGKKKGPLRKLSKCLFFWGKRGSRKESKEDAALKRAHSESSVANNPQPGNLMLASSEQDVDVSNIGECSGSQSHFHIQINCEIADAPELESSGNVMPPVELQHPNVEENFVQNFKEPRNKNATSIDKLDQANGSNMNKLKSERFIVSSISEENKEYDGINRIYPKKSENIVLPKNGEKCQDKPLICQSKFYTVVDKNDTTELHSKAQESQPDHISDTDTNENCKNDSKPFTFHHSLSVVNNNDNISSEPQVCIPSIKSVNDAKSINEQSKSQIYQSGIKFVNSINVSDQKSEPQTFQPSLISDNSNNKIDDHKTFLPISSSDNHVNTVEDHTKPKPYQSSHSLVDHNNDLDEHSSELQSLQTSITSENHNDIEEKQPESQNFQLTLGSSNHVNNIGQEYSVSQIFQPDLVPQHHETHVHQPHGSLPDCTKINDESIFESQIDLVDIEDSDSTSSTEDIPQFEVQYDLDKNQGFTDYKEKYDVDNVGVGATYIKDAFEPNLSILPTLSSDNHVNSDQASLNCHNTTVTNNNSNRNSCLDSDNFEIKETPQLGESGNHLNEQPIMNSHSHASTQGTDAYRVNRVSLQVDEKNGDPTTLTKPDVEDFDNEDKGQVLENYPSINLIKGTPDIGTTVVLPYSSPARENENWKVLSDLRTNGNCQTTGINRNSEMLSNLETQVSMLKDEISKKQESKSEQRNNALPSSAKHSRLPVRKSVGSEDIVDRLPKLSIEIEEINTNIKQQKPVYNRTRSNSGNRSKSKIPRKCANDSLSPK